MARKSSRTAMPAASGPSPRTLSPYVRLFVEIKERVRDAQLKAAVSVNSEMIRLYWTIGRDIAVEQTGYGTGFIERLSRDLLSEFPAMEGFSVRNLYRMRLFYRAFPEEDGILPQVAAELYCRLPWMQCVILVERLKDPAVRNWYAAKAVENGWSRTVLTAQIDTDLHGRQGLPKAKAHNFASTLPAPQSELAAEMIKDPYNLDFLMLREDAKERELENALTENITKFLLELGTGFAFMGRQYRLEVGGQEYYLDLLFYHHRLRCLVVIELKIDDFKPEYAGKMNFYLSAVDDLLKQPEDQPSIGIILCRGRNKTIVEYALRQVDKPIGVAQYRLTKKLPAELKNELPNAKDLMGAVGSGLMTLPPLQASGSGTHSKPKPKLKKTPP